MNAQTIERLKKCIVVNKTNTRLELFSRNNDARIILEFTIPYGRPKYSITVNDVQLYWNCDITNEVLELFSALIDKENARICYMNDAKKREACALLEEV